MKAGNTWSWWFHHIRRLRPASAAAAARPSVGTMIIDDCSSLITWPTTFGRNVTDAPRPASLSLLLRPSSFSPPPPPPGLTAYQSCRDLTSTLRRLAMRRYISMNCQSVVPGPADLRLKTGTAAQQLHAFLKHTNAPLLLIKNVMCIGKCDLTA